MNTTKVDGAARLTGGGWTRSSFVLGVLAVALYAAGFVALDRIWPGDPVVIGIATTLQYVLPLAGVIVGHGARRREGPRWASTLGLVLSYLCLAAAVVPVVLGTVGLLLAV